MPAQPSEFQFEIRQIDFAGPGALAFPRTVLVGRMISGTMGVGQRIAVPRGRKVDWLTGIVGLTVFRVPIESPVELHAQEVNTDIAVHVRGIPLARDPETGVAISVTEREFQFGDFMHQ